MSKAREFNGDLKPVLSGFHTVENRSVIAGKQRETCGKNF